tara:strand:+ start:546 stop:1499 length:954 start_codon:yes stop_codon:yes gene_type:complete
MILATPSSDTGNSMLDFISNLQHTICDSFLTFENKQNFHQDTWSRPNQSGGGISCVFEDGNLFEKAGINISAISGSFNSSNEQSMFLTLLSQLNQNLSNLDDATYFATGISVICHPINPFIPTIHMNYRYFEIQTNQKTIWWFGGGCDLTPYFLDNNLISNFHSCLKSACDSLDITYYPRFKNACDSYFYLPHRHEHRGVGGIFFDYLYTKSPNHYLDLVKSCGNVFLDSYLPFITSHKSTSFTDDDTQWQQYRRGRYVEFNLLHDRGTKFGLQTNGRIESIFMSLPKHVIWTYHENLLTHHHKDLLSVIKSPQDWI